MPNRLFLLLLATLSVLAVLGGVALADSSTDDPPAEGPAGSDSVSRPASSFDEGELPDRPDRMEPVAPQDLVTVGAGDSAVEMTLEEARAEADKLADDYDEQGDGVMPLWGARSDGTTGAIAECSAVSPVELLDDQRPAYQQMVDRLPEDVDPSVITMMVCQPAPGHQWPESAGPDWDPEIPLDALDE